RRRAPAARGRPTSSVERWRTVAVPPIESGESTPSSGNSSARTTSASPKSSSTWSSLPPGTSILSSSSAPSASRYHCDARAASRTTRCGVISITLLSHSPRNSRGRRALEQRLDDDRGDDQRDERPDLRRRKDRGAERKGGD